MERRPCGRFGGRAATCLEHPGGRAERAQELLGQARLPLAGGTDDHRTAGGVRAGAFIRGTQALKLFRAPDERQGGA